MSTRLVSVKQWHWERVSIVWMDGSLPERSRSTMDGEAGLVLVPAAD